MSLDKNLFTLNVEQSKIEPGATDLVDPSGTVHYRKRMLPNDAGSYLFSLSEPLSDSLLATVTAPSPVSKEKVIELHNPSVTVPLSFKGTLTFKWTFAWENQEYHWKREECYMVRKPDPPVLVAITKEPPGKIKTSVVQILDYNLNRFDIEDRKGLEIVLLSSLLTFSDQSEQLRAKPGDVPAASPPTIPPTNTAIPPPPPPPKPDGWMEDQIAILQAKEQRDINEVVIGETGSVDDYAKHCCSLLNDDTLLFITLRSQSPECVPKVVQVASATKRIRYKNGAWDEDLHQYVSTEDVSKETKKGKGPPRIINLDDGPQSSGGGSKPYQPPVSLTIHLSKIAMPELEPKAKKPQQPSGSQTLAKPGGNSKPPPETQPARLGKPSKPAGFIPAKVAKSSSPSPRSRSSSAPQSSSSSPPPPSMPSQFEPPHMGHLPAPQNPPSHRHGQPPHQPPHQPHHQRPPGLPPQYSPAYPHPPAGAGPGPGGLGPYPRPNIMVSPSGTPPNPQFRMR